MPDRYPNAPGVRPGAPETSHDAAASVADTATNREAMALRLIRDRELHGATADEVADALEWERHSSRPRLSTLKALRRIVDSGARRHGASGRRQAVWIASEYAPQSEGSGLSDATQGDLWDAA